MSEGPLEGGDVWGPGRVPHGASPPSSGPATSHPAGPLEPEATYQRQAKLDVLRREGIDRVVALSSAVRATRQDFAAASFHDALDELANCAAEALLALAVAERERDQAREALRQIVNNAEAWHGPPPEDSGHVRALAVIATWARAALGEEPS